MTFARRLVPALLAAAVVLCFRPVPPAHAQSSQAALFGRVTSAANGQPVPRALVVQRNLQTNQQSYKFTNEQGLYSFAAVPPGVYTVRVDSPPGFVAEERSPVELPVASRIELNFTLKAGAESVAAAPAIPTTAVRAGSSAREVQAIMYGADAAVPQAVMIQLPVQATETLVGSLSSLIDEREITELALSGRDVYTLLVLQPGVTSDNATGRGLGFSVNGQRAASSNFLLDGVDNNDLLVTGPATRVSADAVKEYRMSTNSYSAEYGRASGFIANAITRSGTNDIHGVLYEFFNHDRLNANSFFANMAGRRKPPYKQNQFGGTVGGPVKRDRLFYFANLERFHSSSRSQQREVYLPSQEIVSLARDGSIAKQLFTRFPVPEGEPVPGAFFAALHRYYLPLVVKSMFALGRLDYSTRNGKHRISGRYSFAQQTSDDLIYSIYPSLNAPLVGRGQNLATNYTRDLLGGSNELKFGFNRNRVSVIRPHSEVPTFGSTFDGLALPGSEAAYSYNFRDTILHFLDNYSRLQGKHSLGIGFEWRQGLHDSLQTPGRDGLYITDSVFNFIRDDISTLLIAMGRQTGRPATDAEFGRFYRQKEFAWFLQDNLKLTRRLTLNLGLRYEFFGVPAAQKTTRDFNFVLGQGATVGERVASGRLEEGPIYRSDRNNLAPRFGFALDLFGSGKSVLRGGYGIFFDRVFNNFWMDVRGNSIVLQFLTSDPTSPFHFRYSIPASAGVQPVAPEDLGVSTTIMVDRNLRTPYGQSWFVGYQQQLTPNMVFQVDHTGSLGRKLATADNVNRFGMPTFNPRLGNVSYRANQGTSDFLALQANLLRRWSKGVQFQVSYTMSRTHDVQSDPLSARAQEDPERARRLADFFQISSAFTRPFDPKSDYGRSDFDQTHNLVFNIVAQGPQFSGWRRVLLGGWQVSTVTGFRSGFPFTVLAGGCETGLPACEVLHNNRADFTGQNLDAAFLSPRRPIPGGFLLLDRTKFRPPEEGQVGNQRRNSLRGPGFWNADFSVMRNFPLRFLGEQGRLQFRAEFFNLFNHTNLSDPDSFLLSDTFGEASFGRQGFASSLPSASPLNEQPRRIQFALKFYF